MVSLSAISVTHSQPWSKNIKYKIPRAFEILLPGIWCQFGSNNSLKKRKKQFIHFKLHAVQRSMMNSRTVQLCAIQNMNPPFVENIHASHATCLLVTSCCLGYQVHCQSITVLVSKSSLFYLKMSPKHKNSDAGNSDTPKKSHEVFPLSEKVKVLKGEKKNHMLRLVRSMVRNSSGIFYSTVTKIQHLIIWN